MSFSSLDPQLQGTIIGGTIAGAVAILVALLTGLGWLVQHRLQVARERRHLRRIKLEHVMERLIELPDWYGRQPAGVASHPGDHILWLCEVYGGSQSLVEAATKLRDACDRSPGVLRRARDEELTAELQRQLYAFGKDFSSAVTATRVETIRLLRALAE
jgi:hypothetical protein